MRKLATIFCLVIAASAATAGAPQSPGCVDTDTHLLCPPRASPTPESDAQIRARGQIVLRDEQDIVRAMAASSDCTQATTLAKAKGRPDLAAQATKICRR